MFFNAYRCSYFAKEDVVDACKLTLKNLQLDYLDLYLVSNWKSRGTAWIKFASYLGIRYEIYNANEIKKPIRFFKEQHETISAIT